MGISDPKLLAKLKTSIAGKIERVLHERIDLSKEISRQDVEIDYWLFVSVYDKYGMRERS